MEQQEEMSTEPLAAEDLADMVIDLIEEWPADGDVIAQAKQLVLERLVTASN